MGNVRDGHLKHILGQDYPKALRHEDSCRPKECRGEVDVVERDRFIVEGVCDAESDEIDVLGELHDEVVPSNVLTLHLHCSL